MWEVVAKSRSSGTERKIITKHWYRVNELTQLAMDKNWQVRVRQYFTDVLVADGVTGEFAVIAVKLTVKKAAAVSVEVNRFTRKSGCLLWPHGMARPTCWIVRD